MTQRPSYPWIRLDAQGDLVLQVLVVPGSGSTRIEGLHGEGAQQSLRIRLQAPPVNGQAHAALMHAMAQQLGLHFRELQLERGHSSRLKKVRIATTAVPRISWGALQCALQS